MKRRLVTEGAEVLGGEFFLVEDWLVHNTWSAGKYAAEKAMDVDKTFPVADSATHPLSIEQAR